MINLVEYNLFTIEKEITFLPFQLTQWTVARTRGELPPLKGWSSSRMWRRLSCFYYSLSSCPSQCVKSIRSKGKRRKKEEHGENLFLHSCNDNISFAIRSLIRAWLCSSRQACWREWSISIKRLKLVLRIHDQFKHCDGGGESFMGPSAPDFQNQLYWLKHASYFIFKS